MNSDTLLERSSRVLDTEAFLGDDVRDFVPNQPRRTHRHPMHDRSLAKYLPRRKYIIWSAAILVIVVFVGVGLLELANWPTIKQETIVKSPYAMHLLIFISLTRDIFNIYSKSRIRQDR